MTIVTAMAPPPARMPGVRDRNHRLSELIAAASIEISPRDDPVRERLPELLAPGTTVFVNHAGSVTHHDIVAACVRLRQAGFTPIPHVAARRLASFTQARDFFERATAEAGVTSALVIAGDVVPAVGPFRDSLDLLATGVIEGNGIEDVVFAGYPEGHPRVDRHSLDTVFRAKIAAAHQRGLGLSIVTQFGFDAEPIRRWIVGLREDGILCPIRVGVAGPATVATLAKFAVRCGIGASLRALGRGQTAFARILTEATPDALIEAVVTGEDPGTPFDGFHFFSFGSVHRTAAWLHARSDPAPTRLSE